MENRAGGESLKRPFVFNSLPGGSRISGWSGTNWWIVQGGKRESIQNNIWISGVFSKQKICQFAYLEPSFSVPPPPDPLSNDRRQPNSSCPLEKGRAFSVRAAVIPAASFFLRDLLRSLPLLTPEPRSPLGTAPRLHEAFRSPKMSSF